MDIEQFSFARARLVFLYDSIVAHSVYESVCSFFSKFENDDAFSLKKKTSLKRLLLLLLLLLLSRDEKRKKEREKDRERKRMAKSFSLEAFKFSVYLSIPIAIPRSSPRTRPISKTSFDGECTSCIPPARRIRPPTPR